MASITPAEQVSSRTIWRSPRPEGVGMEDIARLWGAPAPYISALIDTTTAAAGRAKKWEDHAKRLLESGASSAAVDVLCDETRRPSAPETSSMAVLVADDGVSLSIASPDPLVHERVELGTLPRTAVVIDWAQRSPAHLLVEVTATLTVALSFEADGSVIRHDLAIDALDAVPRIAELARQADAAAVVVAGSSRELVRGVGAALSSVAPPGTSVVAVEARSEDEIAESTVRAIADGVARDTVSVLRSLALARASDKVADGVVDVVEALRTGLVEELVVHDDPDDGRLAWFGPHPADIAIDLEHASLSSADVSQQGPLVEVLIRSCVLQGGTVRVVPAVDERRLSEGVGATLNRDS